jgi:predicted permease
MEILSRIRSFFYAFFRASNMEKEMQAELQFHIESYAGDLMTQQGLSREKAFRQAHIKFGSIDKCTENAREARGLRITDQLRQDTRYALRQFCRNPGFTAAALISLSLGIAVASAAFSIMNGLVLRDVPAIGEAEGLLLFEQTVSYPDYKRYRDREPLFSASTAYAPAAFSVSTGGRAHRVWGHLVTSSYFTTLRVNPELGRFFNRQDEQPGHTPSAIVSYEFWRNRMSSDPAAIGRTLHVNGQICTVIGIGPKDFQGASPMSYNADLWLPIFVPPNVAPELAENALERRDKLIFHVLVRLQLGVAPERAEAELEAMARQIEQEAHDTSRDQKDRRITLLPGGKLTPMPKQGLPSITGYFAVLGGIILLIASANVANMLLAQTVERRNEIAMRLAIGASRSRLVRQLLTECALIAAGAGLLGFIGAILLTKSASGIQFPFSTPLRFNFLPDSRVLVFTFVLTAFTALAFGLAPAIQATGASLTTTIKGGSNVVFRRFRCMSLRNLLIVSQVAGSLALLLVTGFLVIGHRKLVEGKPGFDSRNLYLVSVDPIRDGLSGTQTAAYIPRLLNRIQSLPFVVSASLGSHTPMDMIGRAPEPVLAGSSGSAIFSMERRFDVSRGYLAALKIPIVRGRNFIEEDETNGTTAIIVNEVVARNSFPGKDPIGQRIEIGTEGAGRRVGYVVGVAGSIRDGVNVGSQLPGIVYLPLRPIDLASPSAQGLTLVVRTCPSTAILSTLQRKIESVDDRITPFHIRSMEDQMERILSLIRATLSIYGAIGVFGLILTSVGLAGVTAYSVAQRRREIGIRMALGAHRINVLGMVMKEGTVLIAVGTIVGFACAWAAIRALASVLEDIARATEISASEPVLLFGAPTLLALLALLCCYLSARKATRIDPAITLRAE